MSTPASASRSQPFSPPRCGTGGGAGIRGGLIEMPRLAKPDVQKLREEALKGNRAAAVELARAYDADTIRELLEVLCPAGKGLTVAVFDVACDAVSLIERVARRPVLSRK